MATKTVKVAELGTVKLYKRKGARSIRLSVTPSGEVRVSLPAWLPYDAGVRFAQSKLSWILSQQVEKTPALSHGQAIGKSHHLYFWSSLEADKPTSRIQGTTIKVIYPVGDNIADPHIQKVAEAACIRALRSQASKLLPQRLQALADSHGCVYVSANIKQLKGRWGSCDTDKNIVLNLFLMQLPWHLIDYVLLHELAHTQVLHHGPEFWKEFERLLPNAKRLRKEIRGYSPSVGFQAASA
jgi:predicted metal-dependent hydrolase